MFSENYQSFICSSKNFSVRHILVKDADVLKDWKFTYEYLNNDFDIIPIPSLVILGIINYFRSVLSSGGTSTADHSIFGPLVISKKFAGYDFDSVAYFVQYATHRIQFISCGDTFIDQRSYYVFLPSYDVYVWILIVFILFIFVPIAWMIIFNVDTKQNNTTESPKLGNIIMSIFKALIEQSTPFKTQMLLRNNILKKNVISCLLLAVLVLSNAYKNDNIKNLISPMRFRPFDSFQQIMRNKYTVFSASDNFRMVFLKNRNNTENVELFRKFDTKQNHSVYSKPNIVWKYDSVVKALTDLYWKRNISLIDRITQVYKNSSLKFVNIVPYIILLKKGLIEII